MVKNKGDYVITFYCSTEMREAFHILKKVIGKNMESLIIFGIEAYINMHSNEIYEILAKSDLNTRNEMEKEVDRLKKELDDYNENLKFKKVMLKKGELKAFLEKGIKLKTSLRYQKMALNHLELKLSNYINTLDSIKGIRR